MSSWLGDQVGLHRQRAALAPEADRGKRSFADDHRVDELDRDVADVGPGAGEKPSATSRLLRANRSAIR